MPNKYISLGMAIQAFLVAYLSHYGHIIPTPFQQFMAGVLFLGLFFIRWILEYAKNNVASSKSR